MTVSRTKTFARRELACILRESHCGFESFDADSGYARGALAMAFFADVISHKEYRRLADWVLSWRKVRTAVSA